MTNRLGISKKQIIPNLIVKIIFTPLIKLEDKLLKTTLIEPIRHINIPPNAHWLSGEGAGSWFWSELFEDGIKMMRFSPE